MWLKTRTKPIVSIPYTQECNDVAMMLIQHHKASEYYDRAIDQFEQIYADAANSARIMAIVLLRDELPGRDGKAFGLPAPTPA